MIRVIVTDERELADVMARHDFAPLFGSPYRLYFQEPTGALRSLGGGGVTSVLNVGPVSGSVTATTTAKRRRRK